MIYILVAVYLAGALASSANLVANVLVLIYKLENKQIRSFEVTSWEVALRVIFWPVVFVVSAFQSLFEEEK